MKVTATQYGFVHYYAQCLDFDCAWDAGMLSGTTPEPADVRAATVSHVKKTGHKVVISIGKETVYEPRQKIKEMVEEAKKEKEKKNE